VTSHLRARWAGLSNSQRKSVKRSAVWIAIFVAFLGIGIYILITQPGHTADGITIVSAAVVGAVVEGITLRLRLRHPVLAEAVAW